MKWIDRFKTDVKDMRAAIRDEGTGAVALDDALGPKRERVVALTEGQLDEYQRVAAQIGFAPKGIKTDALRRFLSESGICVYPLPKVVEYLDEQYGPAKSQSGMAGQWASVVATWVWRPLRTADMRGYERHVRNGFGFAAYSTNGAVALTEAPYAKPLPLPVLLTVARILEQFPDAYFYVSDEYKAPPISDPFLAVVYGEDGEPVVIERWDEPRFRA